MIDQIQYISEREARFFRRKLRKQQELRRKCITIFFTIMLISTCFLSYHALVTNANSSVEDVSYKYFSNIIVNYGDTLWDIADTYVDSQFYTSKQEYINEVIKINHLSSDQIKAGQYLIIPYYSKEFIK